jgi:hypothetical protein
MAQYIPSITLLNVDQLAELSRRLDMISRMDLLKVRNVSIDLKGGRWINANVVYITLESRLSDNPRLIAV